MPQFEQFDIENPPRNSFKPRCNFQCFGYSILLSISCFFIPFLVLYKNPSQKYNYEFQISPSNSSKFLQTFQNNIKEIIQFEYVGTTICEQYSWRPIKKNYEMDDAMVKYRIWQDGKNDLTLKLKDLFKENVDKIGLQIARKYKDTKKKVELNIHWKKMEKSYNYYSWQQSAKISNLPDFPQITNLKDVSHYFPNANKIFTNSEWINYNHKILQIQQYIGYINNEKVDFDLIIEDGDISFEYKWYEPLTYDVTKIVNKIGYKLVN